MHPEVWRLLGEAVESYRATDRVVVFTAPLLVETGIHPVFDVLVVVSASAQTQLDRLRRDRGMSEEAVRARIAAQSPLEDKAAAADVLLDNEGTLEELERQVERLWVDLAARAASGASQT